MSEASDKQAICELAAAYTDAVNRMDWDAMAEVYCETGELRLGDAPAIVGRDAILDAFEQLMHHDRDYVFQMTHSGLVEVNGSTARGRWWFSELKKPTDGPPEYLFGVYEDRMDRTEAGWRFASRSARQLLSWAIAPGNVTPFPLRGFQRIAGLAGSVR